VQPVEALLARLEQVGSDIGRDAGVVHQQVDAPKLPDGLGDQPRPVGGDGDIALHVKPSPPAACTRARASAAAAAVAGIVDGDAAARAGQFNGKYRGRCRATRRDKSGFLAMAKSEADPRAPGTLILGGRQRPRARILPRHLLNCDA